MARRRKPASAPPAKIGRPSKLTPELQTQIVALIKGGNFAEVAARQAGISTATYFDWMARGRELEQPFLDFAEAIREAEAHAESRATLLVANAMPKDWKAAAWYLERKFQDRWGKRLEHTGAGGGPIQVQKHVTFGGRYKPKTAHA